MAAVLCPECKKPLRKQGGQWICMNPSCPNYLVGREPSKSPIAKAIEDQS